MIEQYLIFIAVIVIPFPIGFALAHFRPHSKSLKNAALSALPIALPCFAYAIWIALTQDLSCPAQGPCENMAQIWLIALCVIGVLTGVTGFGVGLLGDAYARRRAQERKL
ncbi:hypothetical protein [Aurantiacibacter rhizosphaerae]|uniref:Uncharacterized protein n=1 Tax=Aurantiacibacter rhizosphaerae TaxID=2691582 RepID=A0A844XFB7_9SPHN|nr:hypothetical protein [Aurantiacibacter rhizosphaerae]MWV28268.1 hypothetical protein [Aurantiacibacter rhizosphaerae]